MKKLCLFRTNYGDMSKLSTPVNETANFKSKTATDFQLKALLLSGVVLLTIGATLTILEMTDCDESASKNIDIVENDFTKNPNSIKHPDERKSTCQQLYLSGICIFSFGTLMVLSWVAIYQWRTAHEINANRHTESIVRYSSSMQISEPYCYPQIATSPLVTYYSSNNGKTIVRSAQTVCAANLKSMSNPIYKKSPGSPEIHHV